MTAPLKIKRKILIVNTSGKDWVLLVGTVLNVMLKLILGVNIMDVLIVWLALRV